MISIDIFDTAVLSDSYRYFDEYRPWREVLEHCVGNEAILRVYSISKNNFIFVSHDTYSVDALKEILCKCGYKDPEVVTVSHEVSKESGLFFKEIEKKIGKHIDVHYGDNYEQDIEGAYKAGINAVFNPALGDLNLDLPDVKDKRLKQYLAKTVAYDFEESLSTKPIKVFASFLAPIILEFTKWVLNISETPLFVSKSLFSSYVIAKEIFKENVFYKNIKNTQGAEIEVFLEQFKDVFSFEPIGLEKSKNYSFVGEHGFFSCYSESLKAVSYLMETEGVVKLGSVTKSSLIQGVPSKKIYLANLFLDQLKDSCEKIKTWDFNKDDLITLLDFVRRSRYFWGLYNDPLLIEKGGLRRSCINFDKNLIKIGLLKDLYNESYDKSLFKAMIKEDFEYSCLVKLL